MKLQIAGAALFAALATSASAETSHDRKLEQAVMDIVAAKIGDIRGGFHYDREPELVTVKDAMATGSIGVNEARPVARRSAGFGLTLAVDRRASRVIAF